MLFAAPFRIFFFSAALWAAVAVPLWLALLHGQFPLGAMWQPALWHPRSLLWGLVNPAIAGFLLTAVCVWTQTDHLHGRTLFLLWLVWLAGRVLGTVDTGLPDALVMAVDSLFLPLVLLDAGRRVRRARQPRQLLVLVPVGLLWLSQTGYLLTGSAPALDASFVLTAALMLVIGGRIVPAFSGNWLRQQQVAHPELATPSYLLAQLLASVLCLILSQLLSQPIATGVLALAAAAVTLVMLWGWRGWLVRREPLLWILHLSLLWLPVSFALLAGYSMLGWPAVAWQHAFGIGGAGGLILGVMTRVGLGHTGRPLQLPKYIVSAYVLLQLAVVSRLLVAFGWVPWQPGVQFSGVCWTLAFALFLWRYTPILWAARVDGKPG